MPGDNFNFRRALRRTIDRLLDRALPRTPKKPRTPPADPTAAVAEGVAAAYHQANAQLDAEQRSAPYEAPIVPGTGRQWTASNLKRAISKPQQRILSSREALRGRALAFTGPSAQSQERSPDLTLGYIASIRSQAQRSGWLYNKADLDARLLREDSQIHQTDRSRRACFYKARHTVAPKDSSRLSYLVCNAVSGILDEIDGFDSSMAAFGIANGSGIAMQEVVYRPIRLRIVTGPRQSMIVPSEGVEALHPIPTRSLVYDIDQEDEPYILQGAFDPVHPFRDPETGDPMFKCIYHRSYGDSMPRMRGYMYAAHPLAYLKNLTMERLGILVETFALATPYVQNPPENNVTDEDEASVMDALTDIGKGIPAVIPAAFGEVKTTPVPSSMTPIHSMAIGIINAEIAKLVLSSTLQIETNGGVGSYALGNVHADQQEDVQNIDLKLAAQTERTQLVKYIVELNSATWARAFAPYCPGEDCSPESVRACLPRVTWTINRKVDPVQRLGMFVTGKENGLLIDASQVYEECDFQRAGDSGTAFGGEPDGQKSPEQPSEQPAAGETSESPTPSVEGDEVP